MLACFLVSGFSALCYQTVWMRLAIARFGVNASVVASVLAVFMLGLAVGSFGAGRLLGVLETRFKLTPLRVYALAELLIAVGGVSVPCLFDLARRWLLALGPASGLAYSAAAAVALTVILLPFCAAMGLTYPSAIAFLRRAGASGDRQDPFGGLYLVNVLGALLGTIVTSAVLIELLGFAATSRIAAAGNAAIALAAWAAFRTPVPADTPAPGQAPARSGDGDADSRVRRAALFTTGFATMGLEVVWMRMYPSLVGTFVYSFALIIGSYLLATTGGSFAYRVLRRRGLDGGLGWVWPWLVAASVLPLFSASTTLGVVPSAVRVFVGLMPFCALLGLVTPLLVDREAGDDPARAGRAYGFNLLGCLLGPIVAGFVLLPAFGTRGATLGLVAPLALLALAKPLTPGVGWIPKLAVAGVAAGLWFSTTLFEEGLGNRIVRHDHVATVVAATGGEGKQLFVNGVGMTHLTTITKMMAHFPAAHLRPRAGARLDALAICFGMGTSFRSLASWDANVTAVELVPSVSEMFGYYFPDGPGLLAHGEGRLRIVHDDGRRFLDRTPMRFDLITIDPPPPVEAAGSSLLYSKEFYASTRARLKPGGILQTWVPSGDGETVFGVLRSLVESFRYVRAFKSIDGWGMHFLASDAPILPYDAATLVANLPPAAVRDLLEWIPGPPIRPFEAMLSREHRIPRFGSGEGAVDALAITDDRPINEFYALRKIRRRLAGSADAESK
jgi:spermidine synthase